MFSPDVTSAASARNPRRRVRAAASDESLTALNLRPSTKRRKRSSLAPDTFEPNGIAAADPSQVAPAVNGYAKLPNGHGSHQKEPSPEATRSLRDVDGTVQSLVSRSKGTKRGERRVVGRELGLLQAETDHYSVWKDSDLPSSLQGVLGKGETLEYDDDNEQASDTQAESWRADLAPGLGYAVALTHTQAIVWPYARDAGFADGSKTLTVKLPFHNAPSRYSKDPLPLSALVHDASVGELALLVILPMSGKLVYWESLASAAKADTVRQRQQGIQGAINGLYSSEQVNDIIEAEPDGFVLTTSYGRIFHLSVRDLQGRPHISSSVLQAEDPRGPGFLGSLRHVFGGATRKEIAAVRCAPARSKSSRRCIIAHTDGSIQTWELARHGTKLMESEVPSADAIHSAISAVHPTREDQRNSFRVLDFTFSSRTSGNRKHPSQQRLMLLCGYPTGPDSSYYLVDAILQARLLDVQVVHPISRWPRSTSVKAQEARLRLLVPEPEHTAFVVGEDCIVLVSIKEVEESPDAQLQLESHTLSEPFQDVLMLKTKRNYRITASAVRHRERGSDKAACDLLVDNFGFARVAAAPAVESESDADRRSYLCRSQIEQGVFFGIMPENLLDFSNSFQTASWTADEVEQTTIAINDSIVSNKSKRIAPLGPSMENHLRDRAKWLNQLLLYVGKSNLSARARWHLLWSAERMAAAEAVWTSYSDFLRTKTLREKLLFPELLDIMKEAHKHENRPELGETDIVRHYLLNDIASIELLVPYAEYALGELYGEGAVKKPAQEARFIHQAMELQIAILRTAFAFRTNNAASYGFSEDSIDGGLYKGDYRGLPYFWTSPEESPSHIRSLVEQAFDFATTANEVTSPVEGEDADLNVLAFISASIPALIGFCCRVYEERLRWLRAQPDSESKERADSLNEDYITTRRNLVVKLLAVELEEDGFALGEQYRDVGTLAELLARSNALNQETLDDAASPEEDVQLSTRKLEQNKERMDRYLKTYGDEWAEAMFGYDLRNGTASNLLKQPAKYDKYIDRFLAKKPGLKKLRWIQAVVMGSYNLSAEILEDNGYEEESLWACKVNLSMAKLCKMAAQEQKQIDQAHVQESKKRLDAQLAVVDIQEQLYVATRPVLRNAIDQLAEVDLAMDSYGRFVKGKPYLEGKLKACFEKLVQRHRLESEELLDMLTLMSPSEQQSYSEEFMRQRFVLALRLLRLCPFDEARASLHRANIWRRCLLQDDWAKLNRTEHMTDEKVAKVTANTMAFRTLVAGIREGLLDKTAPISLEQISGAGTTSDLLRASEQYSAAADDLLEALAADLQAEDAAVEEAGKKGRLELWWPGVVQAACDHVDGNKHGSGKVYDKHGVDAEGDVRMD